MKSLSCIMFCIWCFVFGAMACQPIPPQAKKPAMAESVNIAPGNFSSLPSSGNYRTLAVDDLDNDGNLDIVGGASAPVSVAIWYGLGDGAVSRPLFLPFKGDVRSVALGDVDNDGFKDIVLSTQRESSGVMVWKNSGGRRWYQIASPVEIGTYYGVGTADINMDGNLDIVAANGTLSGVQNGIQVWLGDGTGHWPKESGPTNYGPYIDVAVYDFNKDGFLDIAGAGWGVEGALIVWLGDGRGGWKDLYKIATGSFYKMTLADYNRDGNSDILVGTHRGGPRTFIGDGLGNFNELDNFIRPESASAQGGSKKSKSVDSYWQVLPFDTNNNGSFELILTSPDGKGVQIWSLDGSGLWLNEKKPLSDYGSHYDLVVTDFDKNSKAEVFCASFGEGIKVWRLEGFLNEKRSLLPSESTSPDLATATVAGIKENSAFLMLNGIPEYRIGAGDVLTVTIWKGLESNKDDVFVEADGSISISFLEKIRVSGLSVSQASERLKEELSKYFRNPRAAVNVKEYNSKFVSISGALGGSNRGGGARYALSGKMTILDVISDSGGFHQDANLAAIKLTRKNGQTLRLDIYKALNQGDLSQNVVLDDGDLIYVPMITKSENRVYVFGEVANPGAYPFEGNTARVFDVISQAGGVTVFADEKETRVVRGDPANPQILIANMKSLIEEGDQTQNMVLVNGDLIYIPRSGWGGANRFVQQIRPLVELLLVPGRIVRDVDYFNDFSRGVTNP
ncbi:MAG: FG-GAP-like repeat-containing protein [Pseudomonadota bacterium]